MTPLASSPFNPILFLSKILAFNSSSSPTSTNHFLLFYNIILTISYLITFSFRLFQEQQQFFININNVVKYLLLICYLMVFISHLLSNWLNSKIVAFNFRQLEIFDSALKNHGLHFNYRKTKQKFYISLCLSSLLLLYFFAVDVTLEADHMNLISWISIYVPLTLNFFMSFIYIFVLYLLKERYKKLKQLLGSVSQPDLFITVQKFTGLYLDLTRVSNSLIKTFSMQIGAMFLLILVSTTSQVYMLLKIPLQIKQYLVVFNSLAINILEVFGVVFAFSWTRSETEDVVAACPKLITGVGEAKSLFRHNIECYFLVKGNRLEVKILGLFALDPSILLSMAASMVGYLVVVIQFKDSETDWKSRSSGNSIIRVI